MALKKITEAEMDAAGVCSVADVMTGTAAENKRAFDRMVRELVAPAYNACADVVNTLEEEAKSWETNEAARQEAERQRQAAEEAREDKETGYVARAETAAEAAEVSAANAKISETAAAESERKATQAALGQIPDGSLEKVKFAPEVQRLLVGQQLLINSHFYKGALVDQRGGWVVKPNVVYHPWGELTEAGITPSWMQTWGRDDNGNGWITIDGVNYWVDAVNTVRGYVGAGYGIDGFKCYDDGTVLIENDGVVLDGVCYFGQPFIAKERGFLPGRTFTFSALCDATHGLHIYYWSSSLGDFLIHEPIYRNGLFSYTFAVPQGVLENDEIRITIKNDSGGKVWLGAKGLELGTEQTLARKENGNWVLNEIPDYAETLAKCQRHQVELNYMKTPYAIVGAGNAYSDTIALIFVPLPQTLVKRPVPVLSGSWCITNNHANYIPVKEVATDWCSANGISLRVVTDGGLTAGENYTLMALNDSSASLLIDGN